MQALFSCRGQQFAFEVNAPPCVRTYIRKYLLPLLLLLLYTVLRTSTKDKISAFLTLHVANINVAMMLVTPVVALDHMPY